MAALSEGGGEGGGGGQCRPVLGLAVATGSRDNYLQSKSDSTGQYLNFEDTGVAF